MHIKRQRTKTLEIRANNRSSDAISPNFIYGCLGSCRYCYAKRNPRFREYVYVNDNIHEILSKCDQWVQKQQWPKFPNQVHSKLYGMDIGCSTDVALMFKHQKWDEILTYFGNHEKMFATFATKHVNYDLLPFGFTRNRIRFSLMPQKIADVVEPKMSPMIKRIEAIDRFKKAGWDVHINFSPIIAYKGIFEDYIELFKLINKKVKYRDTVKCECICLTHSEGLHKYNLNEGHFEAEQLMWTPKFQEQKLSQYKSFDQVYRYNRKVKQKMIEKFCNIHEKHLSWCEIRYVF